MTDTGGDSVAALIPAKWRRLVYILLAFASALFVVVYSALQDGFQWEDVSIIITGILSVGGFGMAQKNTPV